MWLREERKPRQGFLVPAGGVVSSPALHATGAPSRAWIACVRGVFKAVVESATAAVAIIDANGAHPRMETAWVAAQVNTPKMIRCLSSLVPGNKHRFLSHIGSLARHARQSCYIHTHTNRFCRVGWPLVCVTSS